MRLIINIIPARINFFRRQDKSIALTNINLTSPIDDNTIFMASDGMYAVSVDITEGGGFHNERLAGVIEVQKSVDVTSQRYVRE